MEWQFLTKADLKSTWKTLRRKDVMYCFSIFLGGCNQIQIYPLSICKVTTFFPSVQECDHNIFHTNFYHPPYPINNQALTTSFFIVSSLWFSSFKHLFELYFLPFNVILNRYHHVLFLHNRVITYI